MKMALILGILLLAGCGDGKDWSGAGYQDGYAMGFNHACGCAGYHAIHGKWDIAEYAKAYSEGILSGIDDCKANVRSC